MDQIVQKMDDLLDRFRSSDNKSVVTDIKGYFDNETIISETKDWLESKVVYLEECLKESKKLKF